MTVTGFDKIVSLFDDNHQCWGALIMDLLIRWKSIHYLQKSVHHGAFWWSH